MRIATWNVERLKHQQELAEIVDTCNQAKADILILTETDARIQLPYSFSFHTPRSAEIKPDYYKPTENRVSVFTRYPCIKQHQTYDKYTALCTELETENGRLLVYGTIMGIYGNRHRNFKEDLQRQVKDFKRLTREGQALCIAGDFNLSFSDNYYYTEAGRATVLECFNQIGIKILTYDAACCIDHIAVSSRFASVTNTLIDEWNLDKRLSDHKGIVVEF